jgi:hypothetical protein
MRAFFFKGFGSACNQQEGVFARYGFNAFETDELSLSVFIRVIRVPTTPSQY